MNNSDSGTISSREGRLSVDASSPDQESTAATVSVVQRKGRTKAPPIESVDQLLRAVYTGKFKRTTLKKMELTTMRKAPKLDGPEREEILNLTLLDRTLDRTHQLILLSGKLDGPIANQIREFVREVLGRHPAFGTESLTGKLENLPVGAAEDRAIEALMSQDYASLSWPKEIEPMKKKEMEQCKVNAVCCLLLWFWVTRGRSVKYIQRHLQAHLWQPTARRYRTDVDKLRALTRNRDPAAASIACALLEKESLQQSQRTDAVLMEKEHAMVRVQELRKEMDDLEARLTTSQAEVSRLGEELEQKSQSHADDKAHLKDDYERLRGQVLRRLKDELSLLDEGLHALRRDPPKIHVMVDHAERAIDGLKREMERLRENS